VAVPSTASAGTALPPASATDAPARTPGTTVLDGVPAKVLQLGLDAAPIDIAYAFGSIWVASHQQAKVIRIDPITMTETARIQVGNGPGWFAVTDDAVWVTLQQGRGMARIDPATNTADNRSGMWPPCWAPVVAFGSIWLLGCDAQRVMRVNPTTFDSSDVSVGEQSSIVLADDRLLTVGPKGLSRIDPETGTLTHIGGPAGVGLGFAGGTVWVSDETKVMRVDPASGAVVATLPITYAGIVRGQGDYAWMIQEDTAVLKIDLETNKILRTVPVRPQPASAVEAAGGLWVTSFAGDAVWRVTP
jgi:streptogramin lyase